MKRWYWWLGAVAVLLGGFGFVAEDVVEGETQAFDVAFLMALRRPGHPEQPIGPDWLPEGMRDITALGSYSVLTLIVVAIVGYLLIERRRATAVLVLVSVIGGTTLSTLLKQAFARQRPDIEGVPQVFTASFPSGHATLSAVTYLTIAAVMAAATPDPRLRSFYIGAAVFVTLLVGISRLYLGVHYPTDVVAGWALGTAWALLCYLAAETLKQWRKPALNDIG